MGLDMRIKKSIWIICAAVLSAGVLNACGRTEETEEGRIFQVNYISNDEVKVVTQAYTIQSDLADPQGQVEELLSVLGTVPERLEYKPPLAQGFTVLGYELREGNLVLDMDEEYRKLSVPQEVLTRAALVRTLVQIEGVQYVGVTVSGQPLTDSLGSPIGMMNADTFVDNEGSQINSMEQVRIRLYFTNEEGNGLIAVNRTLVYNTNLSMERLVVEQLVAGPTSMTKNVYPTLNPGTKVLSVTINDGICYVNLDETFLTQLNNASAEVVIYSVVNSLIELPSINKVQISVNGKTDVLYRETVSLSTVFERNLDLVINPE